MALGTPFAALPGIRLMLAAAAVHAGTLAAPKPAASAAGTDVTVAIIQYQVRDADKVGADAGRLAKFIRAAAAKGAKIIVAPETCFYRYSPWERNGVTMAALASEYPALTERFAALAKELRVCLVIGLREPLDAEHVYNTALFFGPDGKVLGKHHKTVPSSAEKAWTRAGKAARAFRTPYGTVGMLICKDAKTNWWKTYNDDRLDLYVLIAGDDDGRSFGSFARTAAEARCHAVLANQVTKKGKGKGNSAYAYPNGQSTYGDAHCLIAPYSGHVHHDRVPPRRQPTYGAQGRRPGTPGSPPSRGQDIQLPPHSAPASWPWFRRPGL